MSASGEESAASTAGDWKFSAAMSWSEPACLRDSSRRQAGDLRVGPEQRVEILGRGGGGAVGVLTGI
ncbi:hypothetical protein [Streptomyces sp. NBC_00247]|uniref:hypothetical protein n=1 Tax=Streptomyces sp. NBC_00247 TaxID=2975689 RepID=UPI003FA6D4DF